MELVLIDHYDSFSFNVLDWLERGGFHVQRIACDDDEAMAHLAANPDDGRPVVISPGPRDPDAYPLTLSVLKARVGLAPILGICLGHQMLGQLAGCRISAGKSPHHGASRRVSLTTDGEGLFPALPKSWLAGVYNSLVVEPSSINAAWRITARCDLTGEVMGLARVAPGAPAVGWQFHPESFLSEQSAAILAASLRSFN